MVFSIESNGYNGVVRQRARQILLLLAMLPGLSVVDARAETTSADRVFDSVAIYAGQGANHNLPDLPGRIASGNFNWDKSYFSALGLGKNLNTLGQSLEILQDTPLASVRQGYEVVLVKHSGLQSNTEIGAAYTLRTPDLKMGPVGVNFEAGGGLSHALGNPSYEDGSKADPARRYRTQLLLLLELEWRVRGIENLSLLTRVHHRSGVYGLIAPRRVGSNFMAAGVRYEF